MNKSLSGSLHLIKCFIVDDGDFQYPLPDIAEQKGKKWSNEEELNAGLVLGLI